MSDPWTENPQAETQKTQSNDPMAIMEKVLLASTEELRRQRRWSIFFKISWIVIVLFFIVTLAGVGSGGASLVETSPHVAVVQVKGVIATGADASAERINSGLRSAFSNKSSTAIVLEIDSPGGSPVQSRYVYDEVNRLKALHPEKKVYAVIADLGASGAYYIAAAADEIYADQSSLVGSIGVTAAGFGYVELLDKLGVERRKYTSGEHKAFLDSFSPEKEDEVAHWTGVLSNVHDQFISAVREGRGERLREDLSDELFSGYIWSGEQAKELGLIDDFASSDSLVRQLGDLKVVDYTPTLDPMEEFMRNLGVSFSVGLKSSLSGFSLQ